MPKSNRFAPTPVMPDYYDDMLAQIMWGQQNNQIPGNSKHAKMSASEMEDRKLRELLGGRRKRRRGEMIPEGAYSLADHEFLGSAIDWARTGNTPGGSAHIGLWLKEQGDRRLRDENSKKRKEWAAIQQRLIGGW